MTDDDVEKVIYALLEVAESQQQAVAEALKGLNSRFADLTKDAQAASLDHTLKLKKGLDKAAREAMAEGLKKGFAEMIMPDIKKRLRKADAFLVVAFFVSSFLGGVLALELTKFL